MPAQTFESGRRKIVNGSYQRKNVFHHSQRVRRTRSGQDSKPRSNRDYKLNVDAHCLVTNKLDKSIFFITTVVPSCAPPAVSVALTATPFPTARAVLFCFNFSTWSYLRELTRYAALACIVSLSIVSISRAAQSLPQKI